MFRDFKVYSPEGLDSTEPSRLFGLLGKRRTGLAERDQGDCGVVHQINPSSGTSPLERHHNCRRVRGLFHG